ncbi:MAG TPA: S8 family serine peptidase [Gaiellales bacterium]|nr:S8 family serine peptidase [Gaiellales bacterium]
MTPAGDRSQAQRAVVAAGGIPAGWVGGRLKAALGTAELAQVRRSPAVADAQIAETSSADAIISQGVALSGADALQRAGHDGSGVTIVVLDQAFGAATRLNQLAGTELPPLERQHRLSFDAIYGLAGRDYNANSSRHGEFVSEIVYDMAPGATYWFINYHTTDEFGQAVDYIANVLKPNIVVHSNSFLFGRFDGTGWFAQKVNEAAAAGVLWVNSAGNYRTRHWEGPWSDADGDGHLDVPGDGNAFRFDLAATSRPACDISWAGATNDPASYYTLALYSDAALTTPVLDKNTHLPIMSSELSASPDPHADMPPGAIASPGPYYVAVTRVGTPPTTNLTVYCRMDMSPTAQVTSSSSPTPGDAAGAFSVGAFDATSLLPEPYSSEGPTDDGRPKPDISAPTNVLITPGVPESDEINACGGTSCATPHVGGAAALIWNDVAAAGGAGSVAERVRAQLVAQALDAGAPGPDPVFGAGRLRLDLAAPVLGVPKPAPNSLVRGTVGLSLPVADAGTLGLQQLSVDGKPLVATLAPGNVLEASWPTAGLPAGPHVITLVTSDQSGNVATYSLTLRVDNQAPKVRLRSPERSRVRAKVRVSASVLDIGSGLVARPLISFGDGAKGRGFRLAHRYKRPGRYVVSILAVDRAGNSTLMRRGLHVRAAPPKLRA